MPSRCAAGGWGEPGRLRFRVVVHFELCLPNKCRSEKAKVYHYPAIAAGDTLAVARHYAAVGLSVIPVRTDGSKAPALRAGEIDRYRERPAADEEFRRDRKSTRLNSSH